jgi:hypothetical protein
MIDLATQYLEDEEAANLITDTAPTDKDDEDDEELISLEPNISLLRAK